MKMSSTQSELLSLVIGCVLLHDCECRAAMISRLIDRSIVRKLTVLVSFQAKASNICWFQLLKHDNLLLFFIFYDSK